MRRAASVVVGTVMALVPVTLAGATRSAAAPDPHLEPRDCGALPPVDVQVTCSWLTVPERHERPGGSTIRLAVAVVHSRAAQPESDPVVYLSGGPGDAAISALEGFATSPLLADRDLVLFDQRGTGISEPSLDCPERAQAEIADLGRAEPHEVELEAGRDAIRACRERLVAGGVHLDAYDTEESAVDVADLRTALGVREWNLYAVSYGTRLALATMRSHPQGIRTAVLDSVYPPDVGGLARQVSGADAAIARLFAACEEEPACAAAHPDLEQRFAVLVRRRNAEPYETTVDAGAPYGRLPLALTGDDLRAALYLALYETNLIPQLPAVVEQLVAGNFDALLAPLAQHAVRTIDAPADGVYLSVECADAARFAGSRQDRRLVDHPRHDETLVRNSALTFCDVWDVPPLPDSFSRTVRSAIPTLVLAGSLDPVTPAADSRLVARQLRDARYVELPGFGHRVTVGTDCPRAVRQAFLDDPTSELDTSCARPTGPVFPE